MAFEKNAGGSGTKKKTTTVATASAPSSSGTNTNRNSNSQANAAKQAADEAAWVAAKEEERRQERVASQKSSPAPNPVNTNTNNNPLQNLQDYSTQNQGVHATVSNDTNPVNKSTNVGQSAGYQSSSGTVAKAEVPASTASNSNPKLTQTPSQTPATTYTQPDSANDAEAQRQEQLRQKKLEQERQRQAELARQAELTRQAELKRKAEEEAARALEQRRQYEARQRDMRLAESARAVEEAKASVGPQSQEEWLQTPEGQQALANQQAQQANDMALREAALRNDPFANFRVGEPEEQRYDARYPRTTTPAQQTTGTTNPLQEWVNREYPEYTGDQSPAFVERNWYRGRELMQPQITVSEQTNNARKLGNVLAGAPAEDETEFWLGNPVDYLDDVSFSGVNLNTPTSNGTYTPTGNVTGMYNPGGALGRANGYENLNGAVLDKTADQVTNLLDRMRPDVTRDEVNLLGPSSKAGTYPYDRYGASPYDINRYVASGMSEADAIAQAQKDFADRNSWPGFLTKAEMSVRNTFNKMLDAADIARAEREWIEAQTANINFDLLNPEEAAALQKNLHDQYQTMISSGEIETPAPRPLVTSKEINERKAKEIADEKARRAAAKERIANDNAFDDNVLELAKDAAEKKGLPPDSVEYWEEISNYRDNAVAEKDSGKKTTDEKSPDNPVNTRPYTANPFVQTSTGDLALESSIRRGDTTYQQVYDDYVANHKDAIGEDDARRLAYQRIYDLGYRPDINDPKSYEHYTTGMSKDFIDALEKAGPNGGNNYYTNEGSYNDRYINMLAGGFDRGYDQERLFDDLTSELAGNAFANQYEWTGKDANDKKGKWVERANPLAEPYATTPGYSGDDKYSQNGALQAALNGGLTTDQILHFYDANYSDLVIPPEAQRWMADDSTRALLQDVINNRQNLDRLQKEHGTKEELFEALRALMDANPGLKLLYDSGRLNMGDIGNQFAKAPVDDTGAVDNPFAGNGGTSNSPYPGYYEWNGQLYPIDQEKAKYYLRYGTYKGWDEGMRDYYNTFGTFYGYRPDWRTAGGKNTWKYNNQPQRSYGGRRYNYTGNSGGNSSNYSRSGGGWSYGGNGNTYVNNYNGNGQGYSYSNNGNDGQSPVNPSAKNQKQNRIYNIMKNWSF